MDEQAFIDGTHPSLHPTSNRPIRPDSPVSAHEDDSVLGEQERVSFITAPRASQTTAREANSTAPPPLVRHTSGAAASNTGPKGVIADFKAQQVHSSTSLSRSLAQVSLSARPAPTVISLTSPTAVAEADDEQQALERYRQMRLEQLRGSGERAQEGGKAAAGRMFGHLREIGMDQFLGAIEEDYGVAVILHLYEPVRHNVRWTSWTLLTTASTGVPRVSRPERASLIARPLVSVHQVPPGPRVRPRLCDVHRGRNAPGAARLPTRRARVDADWDRP